MDEIQIDVGVYTSLEVDLTEFDFTGIEEVILTAKNRNEDRVILERKFTTTGVHNIIVTPEESRLLRNGAEYDFNIITTEGKRYKNGENGAIILREGVGACN